MAARWRLQLIADRGVGRAMRAQGRAQENRVDKLREMRDAIARGRR